MMLSESQERMLMVLRPDMAAEAEAIFRKWGLDFAAIGRTTDDLRFRIIHKGKVEADLPIKDLGDQAPEYDRPYRLKDAPPPLAGPIPDPVDWNAALLTVIGAPDMASRRWVWEQYDHLIGGDTMQRPGGDAAVVRVEGSRKGLAFSLDVTPRYVFADPYEGGKQAVTECWRNLSAVGAEPLAVTDNLNFGNPEKPDIMGELVGALRGIGEACTALDFPIVSGNVSLYNETNGVAILPTPAIGGVGLLPDIGAMATIAFKAADEAIVLIGAPDTWGTHLGQSIYLREVLGREDGPPPPVDLARERSTGDLVRGLVRDGLVTAVHDCSDGGLAVALAEMAMAAGIGATIEAPGAASPLASFFGEDQGRYVVTVRREALATVLERAAEKRVSAAVIGNTGGGDLNLGTVVSISVAKLKEAHDNWFPAFMSHEL
jgi:phosphoribosylformylglycinamidine synthase